ncbi:alpha-E domain-containing protein [Aquabacter sp. L1I39]|uniref:alpha-E domain-containing protein n=1 Tax=Aquabacter sp. L1I39 TaxID=2820278 RepID=UPI001ADAF75E|nr:alpha-E domain-containing protein [Aquabacter sp. L1I39]QTL03687.1 alpha-E domain-containing protein [Aquabacter sp. L1I39]
MLSRTADNIYWLTRYVERADCLARILDVAQRLSYQPVSYGGSTNEWGSAILTAGCSELFVAKHGALEEATEDAVVSFLAFDAENPASIRNCVEMARTNARSVRTALTSDMWDAINGAWIELRAFPDKALSREELTRFLAFVKEATLRFDGAMYRSMLRNDAYWFARTGTHVERADNTARILDVKYHVLLPEKERVGGPLDYFQWASILRSVSALTAFHWVYRDSVKPWLVADLLILNRAMPRSLASCYENLTRSLDDIAGAYGRQGPAQRLARATQAKLTNHSIDDVFQTGLHEFISEFISENNRLGAAINEQYLT